MTGNNKGLYNKYYYGHTYAPNVTYIYTPEDLQNINNNLSGTYYLMNDINFSGVDDWVPLGTYENGFTGKFYGNGHTLTNLEINYNGIAGGTGLFGTLGAQYPVDKAGYIEKVRLDGFEVNAPNGFSIGSLVGGMLGGSRVVGCRALNSVVTGRQDVGGLIGEISNANTHLDQCYAENCVVAGSGENIGGLVADNCMIVTNCYSYKCAVSTTDQATGNVGAFTGYSGGTHSQCWNYNTTEPIGPSSYSFAGWVNGSGTDGCLSFGAPTDPVAHNILSFPANRIEYLSDDKLVQIEDYGYSKAIWRNDYPYGLRLKIFD